jgi:hypothetical protein
MRDLTALNMLDAQSINNKDIEHDSFCKMDVILHRSRKVGGTFMHRPVFAESIVANEPLRDIGQLADKRSAKCRMAVVSPKCNLQH